MQETFLLKFDCNTFKKMLVLKLKTAPRPNDITGGVVKVCFVVDVEDSRPNFTCLGTFFDHYGQMGCVKVRA